MRTFKHFEDEVREIGLHVQEQLAKCEGVYKFNFEIEIEGRTDSGIKVTYRVGSNYDSPVAGATLAAVLAEAMRRKGWQDQNNPKMLTHVTGEWKETEE